MAMTTAMTSATSSMGGMEHPDNSLDVVPLVNPRVLADFAAAIGITAGPLGLKDEASQALAAMNAKLAALEAVAKLSRLAVMGHPHSLSRLRDELHCLSVDYDDSDLTARDSDEPNEDEADDRINLGSAIDLLVGAAFATKDKAERRQKYIIGFVRAIEAAVAFPVVFAKEAATVAGNGTGEVSMPHANAAMIVALNRLIDGDLKCIPRLPRHIRGHLENLARDWLSANPVGAFFDALRGIRLKRIVRWENTDLPQPDDARPGDQVVLLLDMREDSGSSDLKAQRNLANSRVMFCPHEPADVVRVVDDGLQVLVPPRARTGPVAIVKKGADFSPVEMLIAQFSANYPAEWPCSIFAKLRMDHWAYPTAFAPPRIEILKQEAQARNPQQATQDGNMPGKIK